MINHGKHNVIGICIDAIDYDASVERIIGEAKAARPMTVSALAVHGVMTGVLDRVHRFRLNSFDLLVPDGQPVRWALNWLHDTGLRDRVYGPRLMLETCRRAEQERLSLFLYGGSSQLLAALRKRLLQRFPHLRIAGIQASRFRRLAPQEKEEIVATIRSSGAAITFIGLGCPRQEVWAYEFRDSLSMPLVAVGAAFNLHAGERRPPPAAMQRLGLEWLFRLVQEPRRLWRRYLLLNPLYLSFLLLQASGLRRFDPHDSLMPTSESLYG